MNNLFHTTSEIHPQSENLIPFWPLL